MNGQVYRLLVAKTYEMHMFKTASKKLGLDQAVLAGTRPQKGQDKAAPTKAEVQHFFLREIGCSGVDLLTCFCLPVDICWFLLTCWVVDWLCCFDIFCCRRVWMACADLCCLVLIR